MLPEETPDIKTAAMPPVIVTMIGTGTGSGESGTLAKTPEGQPDLITNIIHPARAILVRFLHQFFDAFVSAGALSGVDKFADWNLIPGGAFKAALLFALFTAGWGAMRNIVTILSRLEGKWPLLTGNI